MNRNLLFDAGFTTPKQLASAMRGYARRHPEVGFEVAVLPQVPGTMPRSMKMYGVTESFVKRTWFCLPVAVLNPLEFGLVIGSGVLDPRWNVNFAAKTAPVVQFRWMRAATPAADPDEATPLGTVNTE